MGKKILFTFAGTGLSAELMQQLYEESNFQDNVIRIYFSGCHHKKIGGKSIGLGYIMPDLDVISSKLRSCFNSQGELSIIDLKNNFDKTIIIEGIDEPLETKINVDEINMIGASRGGVTTFAVARFLDDLNIPMNLYAIDPVPGNSKQYGQKNTSEFYKNKDLRHLTHLQHAEISFGVYRKNLALIQNKYFRQMAPLFNEHCQSNLYLFPHTHHSQISGESHNHLEQFLYDRGLTRSKILYDETYDSKFFTPKILQQKPHTGFDIHTPISPRYKSKLLNQLIKTHDDITPKTSFKIGQAVYALESNSGINQSSKLYHKIMHDQDPEAKALREFVVEINQLTHYILRVEFKNEDQYQLDKTKQEQWSPNIYEFQKKIYHLINDYVLQETNINQKQALWNRILAEMRLLKKKIPRNKFTELTHLMSEFLSENVIFHPHLTKYIDEKETFENSISPMKIVTKSIQDLTLIKDADELATSLYHLSKRARANAYSKISSTLPEIIKNPTQLGEILCFFTSTQINKLVNQKEIKCHIKNIHDLNLVMSKLFTEKQRTSIFNCLEKNIKQMESTFSDVGELLQYLPYQQSKSLLASLSLDRIKATSCLDMIPLFEKLSTEQINPLMPSLEKVVSSYLRHTIITPHDLTLFKLIQSKVTDPAAIKIIDKLLKTIEGNINIQISLKNKLQDITHTNEEHNIDPKKSL